MYPEKQNQISFLMNRNAKLSVRNKLSYSKKSLSKKSKNVRNYCNISYFFLYFSIILYSKTFKGCISCQMMCRSNTCKFDIANPMHKVRNQHLLKQRCGKADHLI